MNPYPLAEANGNSMYFVYSIVYTLGFLLMLPAFLVNRQKYASGFRQRLGDYSEFKHDERKVIWLHCVSVGETNAARPLVDKLIAEFPDYRLIVSTITKTGQELARKVFAGKADAVFYLPFDWKFTVRRALDHFKPSLVLLMETEIWPRFIHEAKKSGAKVTIVNGRLSEKSATRYSKVKGFISRVLSDVDLALMQSDLDAGRIVQLGIRPELVKITGNIKFDLSTVSSDESFITEFRKRFGLDVPGMTIVLASSTHPGEEQLILDVLEMMGGETRLIVAPRHPERFDEVCELIERDYSVARRSHPAHDSDRKSWAILLDSIGELRAAYEVADIAIVGGSFVPHGGQNVLEPAAAGKPIITGPFTHNFASVVDELLTKDALVQIPQHSDKRETIALLHEALQNFYLNKDLRVRTGNNARLAMEENRGATDDTVKELAQLIGYKTSY